MQVVSQFAHVILICAHRKFSHEVAELQIITEVNGSSKDFISLTQSTKDRHQLKMLDLLSKKCFDWGGFGLLVLEKTSASPKVKSAVSSC